MVPCFSYSFVTCFACSTLKFIYIDTMRAHTNNHSLCSLEDDCISTLFIGSFSCWWIFRLFPMSYFSKQCCREPSVKCGSESILRKYIVSIGMVLVGVKVLYTWTDLRKDTEVTFGSLVRPHVTTSQCDMVHDGLCQN
jgi:hypothetical protein